MARRHREPGSEEGKVQLFEKYFCMPPNKLTLEEMERLKSIPHLTPGDVKAVWQKYRFLLRFDREHHALLAALEKEAVYKAEENIQFIGFKAV
jgi:hypothetical protein